MAKQILIGITEQELSEIAHYLMIYFPMQRIELLENKRIGV